MRDFTIGGEQATILKWAGAQPQRGSFVDVGAYDGEFLSNTAALADIGWPGICIDAVPDAAKACATRYADRPDVEVVQAAFTLDATPTVTIHWTPGRVYSGLVASQRDDVTPVPINVPALDLDWLADRFGELTRPIFCSIDIEDASLDALQWLTENVESDCVCVEANKPSERDRARTIMADWREITLPDNHVNLLFSR